MSEQYDADYFLRGKQTSKSLYENYRWMPELTVPMVCSMVSFLGIDPDDTILDFGCARGYVVKAFRQEGYNAWGHDISRWALDNADETVKKYLINREDLLVAGLTDKFDWIIAKDVLEHIDDLGVTVDILKMARKGVFVVVPLAHDKRLRVVNKKIVNGTYDVPEYELDVTHIHRRPLRWWVGQFHQPGWSVEGRYRVKGIKDNWSSYKTGNGFITCRRLDL
jgi:SAM-dependent methyltransferase